jgi:hypothetical protein
MLTLSPTVTIAGNDVSSYVVEIERQHSICDTMSTGRVVLSHAYGTSIDTYDSIVISEQGTKTFTGYVTTVNKERLPVNYYVEFADPAIRLVDYWLDQVYESSGETAKYWIGFFCDLAGVSYQFDVDYDRVVPDDYEWEYSSCMDVIRQLIVIGGYYMYSDPDGLIHFNKKYVESAPEDISTGDNILQWHRSQTLDPTRNRAIVFGKAPIYGEVTTTIPELTGRTKTAVVATPYIETAAYAFDLAQNMARHFSKLGDVKVVDVLPNPSWRVGQILDATEGWSGYDETCLITSMRVRMDNSGYVMTLTLDEFCPFIWGYGLELGKKVYASTDGSGVYLTENTGLSWRNINGTTLTGSGLNVRGITASGDVVWAATAGGVYKTINASASGVTWTDETPVSLPGGYARGEFDWTDVEMAPSNIYTAYVLAYAAGRRYMFKTADNGGSYSNVEIY